MPVADRDSKLVLLIEDNEDDEQMTRRALRRNNVDNEVVVAVDGQEAVDLLFSDRLEATPALILLDLSLPRISGLQVLERIRADDRTRRIPVVVLTGSDSEEQKRAAYAAGANSFVQKPLEPSEFTDMILITTMYWLLLNRTARAPLRA